MDVIQPVADEVEFRLAPAQASASPLSWRMRSTIRDIRFEVEMISDPWPS